MLENYYWICTKCGYEEDGYHGSVFNPPEHCNLEMKMMTMDKERIKKRNLKILKNREFLKTLRREVIAEILSQTYGGSYSKSSKTELLKRIDELEVIQ